MAARQYDCCIIGSGLAGSTSAFVLAQLGLSVFVVERGRHPRFAIGESLVPTATLHFNKLARDYGIPELRQISHFPEMLEAQLTGWPKLGFWFGHHRENQPLSPGHEMMFITPGLPVGPDVHMFRADVDQFLVSCLPKYGVEYRERTNVIAADLGQTNVGLTLEGPAGRESLSARFLLDCSGHNSDFARREGLRESPTKMRTNTRVIYSHFVDVPCLEDILGARCSAFGVRRDAGTIHHCFDGGWFWVIRFNNGICSVGLVLDRRKHPDNELSAQEEFDYFVHRFPVVRVQLADARPTRPLVKTGRMQFTSRRVCGDRYLLAPHAASFVDPLYSSGIDLTAAFVSRMAPLLHAAMCEDVFRADRFMCLQALHQQEIDCIDRIVHGTLCSFRDAEVFKQFWGCWVNASLIQYLSQLASDPADSSRLLGQCGASLPSWMRHLEKLYEVVNANGGDPKELAKRLKSITDEYVMLYDNRQPGWDIGSSDACCPLIRPDTTRDRFEQFATTEPVLGRAIRSDDFDLSIRQMREAEVDLERRYQTSRSQGTMFHKGVDFIRDQQF